MEYAVGTFDGARNSYSATHNGQDVMALVNFKPFLQTDSFLKNLNLGGSVDYGYENNPLTPAVLRTSSQVSSAPITGAGGTNTGNVPFLAFNSNVKELGVREQWDLHLAYFHKGLTLLGSWDFGSNSWALTGGTPSPVSVPIGGYDVQAAYLLTGETRTDNGLIDPLRPFDLRPATFGLGAIEPNARFSTLRLDRKVFEAGFAGPNLWTDSVYATDVGFN